MKVGIMQPYFLPYISYFQLINYADYFVFLDDVNFINRGWINRNKILLNGKDYLFTIPLKNASQNKKINEVFISEDNWSRKLLKTIELAYKKAPYFEQTFDLLKSLFNSLFLSISELAKNSITTVCNYLDIDTKITLSSSVFNNNELKSSDRIIDINKQLFATDYANPIGGIEIYDKGAFLKQNINLHFIKTRSIQYNQFNNAFVPYLSVLDVLMFNSKNAIKEMLFEFDLL